VRVGVPLCQPPQHAQLAVSQRILPLQPHLERLFHRRQHLRQDQWFLQVRKSPLPDRLNGLIDGAICRDENDLYVGVEFFEPGNQLQP